MFQTFIYRRIGVVIDRFNPCSNGGVSQILALEQLTSLRLNRFNPCSNGSTHQIGPEMPQPIDVILF